MEEGEEIDLTSSCIEETDALTTHTIKILNHYKDNHPSELNDRKQKFYVPKQPYFQYF